MRAGGLTPHFVVRLNADVVLMVLFDGPHGQIWLRPEFLCVRINPTLQFLEAIPRRAFDFERSTALYMQVFDPFDSILAAFAAKPNRVLVLLGDVPQ